LILIGKEDTRKVGKYVYDFRSTWENSIRKLEHGSDEGIRPMEM
jgi:hypothetical protein